MIAEMGLDGSVLRSVTTALLLAMCCGGKRMCNYREIHVNRDIVLVQLQSLNLSGSFNVLDEKDHCPSGKAHHVMRSIYGMTQQVRCHRDGKPVRDLDRPVQSMVLLLTDNCRQDLVKKERVCPARRTRGKKRQKRRLMNIIKALIHCWQKFQSIISQDL